ncbi:hypothetical protein [Tuwongella immobilis]|uniref:Uncharacterized protein n=1 Tax=Tuwongella immobilis TaxID=692036 RepID=A0A6C2YLV1_9BACT|nr:hypothetical protein [Tuwongella immobilis]VIP02406.1 unnamed protein product [Tuwongella immobilis]VTS01304.1 unnamed protein product [Tuwongella immobilis]
MLFADALRNFAQLVINGLAIAGAFLVGLLLTKVSLWIACRLFFKKAPPRMVSKAMGIVGGVTLAIVVGLLVFGDGTGWGVGTGSSTSLGNSQQEGTQPVEASAAAQFAAAPPVPETKPEVPPPDPKPMEPQQELPRSESERIIVLGGYDSLQRYYQVEGQRESWNLSQLTQYLLRRKTDPDQPLKGITVLIYRDSATAEGPVVAQLRKWAEDHELGVYFPPVSSQTRPGSK